MQFDQRYTCRCVTSRLVMPRGGIAAVEVRYHEQLGN